MSNPKSNIDRHKISITKRIYAIIGRKSRVIRGVLIEKFRFCKMKHISLRLSLLGLVFLSACSYRYLNGPFGEYADETAKKKKK
jgi:hypothetical protein